MNDTYSADLRSPSTRRVALGSALATVVAAAFGFGLARPAGLAADVAAIGVDTDADGLVDFQECLLGTDMLLPDTDADGYWDAEELARGSDPLDIFSLPIADEFSLGTASRAESGTFKLLTALYTPTGSFANKLFTVSFTSPLLKTSGGVPQSISFGLPELSLISTLDILPAKNGGSVFLVETLLPKSVLTPFANFSIYSTLHDAVTSKVIAADAENMLTSASILTSLEIGMIQASASNDGGGPGVQHLPIEPPDELPPAFEAFKVCVQSTSNQGSSGATITLKVNSSDCLPADGFCSPSCANEVDSTIDIVDPLLLIGG